MSATPSGPEPTTDAERTTDVEPLSGPVDAPDPRPDPGADAGDALASTTATPPSARAVDGAADSESDVTQAPGQDAPTPTRPALRPARLSERPPDLRLAALHLRIGMLGLARAELETAAGREALDEAGILDLAEVRWRSGDLRGAATAATAWLDACPSSWRAASQDALAHVVLAESAATRGRDDDVQSHAAAALDALAAAADGASARSKGRRGDKRASVESLLADVFAGIEPYATVWPAVGRTAVSRSGSAILPATPAALPAEPAEPVAAGPARAIDVAAEAEIRFPAAAVRDPAQATLWGAEPAPADEAPAAPAPSPPGTRPDAAATLESAISALPSDPDRAAILFLLALRSGADPATVLHSMGDDGGRPALALVRAEALAAIGRHGAAADVLASAGLASAGGPEPLAVMDDTRSGQPD